MIIVESRAGRRVVGRLDRGNDLFGTLLGLCREHKIATCEVRALGSFEAVELAEYDQQRKVWKPSRKLEGGMEVLNLTGNVSEKDGQLALHCHATLMRDSDNGIQILGGHVVSARVFALEIVLDCFDDVLLRRGVDPATGLTLWRDGQQLAMGAAPAVVAGPPPAAPPRVPPGPPPAAPPIAPPSAATLVPESSSWADVAAASAQKPPVPASSVPSSTSGGAGAPAAPARELEPPADDEVAVKLGDVIDHPRFGRGEVQRIEGVDEFVHVRLASGRLVRLSLDVLKLRLSGKDGNRNVFKARVE